MVINKLRHKYILGQMLHRSYWFGTSYSATGKHYITINRQVIVQLVSQPLDYPIIKTKVRLPCHLCQFEYIEVKTLKLTNTTNLYKMNADIFQIPEGVILLDVLYRVNNVTQEHLNALVLNTNNAYCSIGRNTPIASMHPVGKCEEIQEVSWNSVWCDTSKLLPQILQNTSLQLEPDTNSTASSISDVDIPDLARTKLWEVLDWQYL